MSEICGLREAPWSAVTESDEVTALVVPDCRIFTAVRRYLDRLIPAAQSVKRLGTKSSQVQRLLTPSPGFCTVAFGMKLAGPLDAFAFSIFASVGIPLRFRHWGGGPRAADLASGLKRSGVAPSISAAF